MKIHRLLIAITVSLSLLAGCSQGTNPQMTLAEDKPGGNWGKPEKPKFKIPVTAKPIRRERMYAYLEAVGTVVPIKEIEIKPEMTARIYYTKRWMEGDEVKKGEKFASMDARDLNIDIREARLALESAKAAVLPAKAQLEQASKDVEFRKAMLERGAISKSEYEQTVLQRMQREIAYEQAKKDVISRELALDKLLKEKEKIDITFPFDGVLLPAQQSLASAQREGNETDLTLLQGLQVANGTVLCRLADIDQVYVALDVPAKDLLDIHIGQDVELEIYSRVGHDYKGTVKEISTSLNANTRTYTVNVLVDNPEHELRPGMFAKARIITEERLDAIKIPRELVILRNNRDVVFVATEKPQEEQASQNNNNEAKPEPTQERKQLTMSGGFEKLAVASDQVPQATDTEEFIDLETEEEAEPELEMIAEERVVKTGIENREFVEITDGLKEGELLIVLGYETLTDQVDINVTVRDEKFDVFDNSSEN